MSSGAPPVKRLIQGRPLSEVTARDAVDDYDALAQFTVYARHQGGYSRPPDARGENQNHSSERERVSPSLVSGTRPVGALASRWRERSGAR